MAIFIACPAVTTEVSLTGLRGFPYCDAPIFLGKKQVQRHQVAGPRSHLPESKAWGPWAVFIPPLHPGPSHWVRQEAPATVYASQDPRWAGPEGDPGEPSPDWNPLTASLRSDPFASAQIPSAMGSSRPWSVAPHSLWNV